MTHLSWNLLFSLLALPSVVLGCVFISFGRCSPRRGGAPHWSTCEYNLTGIQSNRCPECGAELTPKTIVRGRRQHRMAVLITGMMLLVIGTIAPIPAAHRWLNRVDWYPYKPTSWLTSELGPPTGS